MAFIEVALQGSGTDRCGYNQRVLDSQGALVLYEQDLGRLRQGRVSLDLSALAPERYTVVVLCDGVEVFRRRLRIVNE